MIKIPEAACADSLRFIEARCLAVRTLRKHICRRRDLYKTTARQAALNKLTFSCAIAAAFAAAPVMAAVVVQDSFTTDTTTANITSRTPDDVNVAGNTYSWRKQGNGSAQTQVTGGVLETGYNHATAI